MVRRHQRTGDAGRPPFLSSDPVIKAAAVALSLGHWPFTTPLLEMDPYDDDWLFAVQVIEQAHRLRWPTERA